MSYDPKTAVLENPTERLRRDITLLSDEQKKEIFDMGIGDLPDADKPELAKKLPQPTDEHSDKLIKNIDDAEKAKHADFVTMRLTEEQQQKVSKRVAEMLKESKRDVAPKLKSAQDEHKPHAPAHHSRHSGD